MPTKMIDSYTKLRYPYKGNTIGTLVMKYFHDWQ